MQKSDQKGYFPYPCFYGNVIKKVKKLLEQYYLYKL